MKEQIDFDDNLWNLAREPEKWDPSEFLDLLDSIVQEAGDNLSEFGKKLLLLESSKGADKELVDSLFRAAHNLKGLSKIIHIQKMATLAKCMENILDEIRNNTRTASRETVDILLEASDVIKDSILPAIAERKPVDADITQALKKFQPLFAQQPASTRQTQITAKPEPAPPAPQASPLPAIPANTTAIVKKVKKEALASQTLRISLEKLDSLMNLAGELVIGRSRLEEKLSDLFTVNHELRRVRRNIQEFVRKNPAIRETKLDNTLEDIGRINIVISDIINELAASTENVSTLTNRLQENVMKARMVPISQLFDKFPRMVRDLCAELKKDIHLNIEGETTEIDKMLVEEIADPLMHLIRNAVDHGIESSERRSELGKPAEGTITLRAYHSSSQMVIEVEDDGAGVDAEKIRDAAIAKGVMKEEDAASLPDEQMMNLIFHAGFSTAKKVTDISGRGVGLDVVKDKVTKFKGTVTVDSVVDRGTKFQIRLPLTLAITNVFLVMKNNETFAIQVSSIREIIFVPVSEITQIGSRKAYNLRGQTLFVLRLEDVLDMPEEEWEEKAEVPLIVVGSEEQQIGLLVDKLAGKREVVIKSVGDYLKNVKYTIGTTILGNGKVALILDIQNIIDAMNLGMLSESGPVLKKLPATKETISENKGKRRYSILVAEDSPSIRKRLAQILGEEGFDVTEAEDGSVALEIARKAQFDLVSTDIVMPHMDGYELTRNLRKLPQYKNIPVIMVTSKSEKIDRVKGFDAGADDYITKPVDKTALLNTIRNNLKIS